MKKFLETNQRYLFISVILVIVTVLTTFVAPFILQTTNEQKTSLFSLIFLIVCAMSLSYVFQIALIIYRENFAEKFNQRTFTDLLKKIYHLNFEKYISLESGNLVTRLFQFVDTNYLFMTTSLFLILKSSITIMVILLVFLNLSIPVFLITFILLPLNLISYRWINTSLNERIERMQLKTTDTTKDLISLLNSAEQFKMIKNFQVVETLVLPSVSSMYKNLASTNKFAQVTSYTITFVNQLAQNVIFILISYLVNQEILQLNNMMVVSILLPLFFTSLSDLTKINVDYRTLAANQRFVDQNLQASQEDQTGTAIGHITKIGLDQPDIIVGQGSKHLHLKVEDTFVAGDIVYIEGPSGSGKSTLIKAILGFYPTNGILINDLPAHTLNYQKIRKNITYLSQTSMFFSDTLEYNITLGGPLSFSEKEKFENSVLLAPIFKNKSWDSVIVDNGANLSGGEKQRLLIARMLLQESDVWILDESTSSIDKDSSDAIFETLLQLGKDKIILFTSHDKSNAEYANKMIHIGG
ncbi:MULTISPECIES: ABC transporter ATP-binding protein [unclassified Enterococcus]|uniref:ATP-binding cassette domain-containing protein n=1 Tax=unclassified Enterococcus TaxID=2608891 RepID=UPI0013EAEE03|nr:MULTISPECIES: ABC transporter ATP-binding protein [unclassified Enterococcus]